MDKSRIRGERSSDSGGVWIGLGDSEQVIYRDASSADEYLSIYSSLMATPTNRLRIEAVGQHLREAISGGARVLDVACGGGAYLKAWAEGDVGNRVPVYGADREAHCADAFLRSVPGSRSVVADVSHCPFRSEAFEVILAIDIIEHIPDDGLFLDELRRLLKPDGVLILVTQNSLSLENLLGWALSPLRKRKWVGWDPLHLRFYDPEGLRRMLRSHSLEVIAFDGTYYLPYHLPSRAMEMVFTGAGMPRVARVARDLLHSALYALNYPLEVASRSFPLKYLGWGLIVVARRTAA